MEIILQSSLLDKVPDLKVNVILYSNIQVGDIPTMLKGRLQLYQEALHNDLQQKEWSYFPGIVAWRKVFKQTGTDPSRYRPSNEALYRRLKKDRELTSIHSAIAVNNLFSLQYEIPFGIYDVQSIYGNVEVRIGGKEDAYVGLNGRENNMSGIIVTSDQIGSFGSPFVDSERTMVTTNTVNALQIVYYNPETSLEDSAQMAEAIKKMFIQIHGGEAHSRLLSINNSKVIFSI